MSVCEFVSVSPPGLCGDVTGCRLAIPTGVSRSPSISLMRLQLVSTVASFCAYRPLVIVVRMHAISLIVCVCVPCVFWCGITDPDQALPVAHTCFFSIDLPSYSSYATLRSKILFAIVNCQAIDAVMFGVECRVCVCAICFVGILVLYDRLSD